MTYQNPNQHNLQPDKQEDQNLDYDSLEKQRLSRVQNEIGARVLTLVGFDSRNKDIVNSSFEKARKRKEKLPGKNTERRNYTYLSRLETLIDKHGDPLEKKLWEASAERLIIKPENIKDTYWKQQEQILRDNGQGRKLTEEEKDFLTENIIDTQRKTIDTWSNYLGDKNCPYPVWFKVYAFDGLSKMGLLNKETKEYEKRDKSTITGFPKLNSEVLAKVYRDINDFFSVDQKTWLDQHSDDDKLQSLVKSGNFSKLYAKELFETKAVIKTPEKTEDINGDWFEYKIGDEEQIAADLAEGTGWCVVDPNIAHNYLTYGQYENDYDEYDNNEEYDNDNEDEYNDEEEYINKNYHNKNSNLKSAFIIFRLKTPVTYDGYASNGSASIRLGTDGKVAEISGLNTGQALEDSLVPIVKEKVLSLPGGEEYLQKFQDKQNLIHLDHKMQNDEDLTTEELRFLYGLDRPISTLDTYNYNDPRIEELKIKYNIDYALEKGIDINELVRKSDSIDLINNLNFFIDHGIDINNIVNNLEPYDIVHNLDTLIGHGADININNLINNLEPYDIVHNLDTLISHNADINNIVNNLEPNDIVINGLDFFINHGADINNIVNNLESYSIDRKLDTLIDHGADINNIVNNLEPNDIIHKLNTLISHGADININELVSKLDHYSINRNLNLLISHGADINNIVNKLESYNIIANLDTLIDHGVDINNIMNNLDSYDIVHNLDTLINHGADINNIVSNLEPIDIVNNQNFLKSRGIDINSIKVKQ